jgi:hypothetical protein
MLSVIVSWNVTIEIILDPWAILLKQPVSPIRKERLAPLPVQLAANVNCSWTYFSSVLINFSRVVRKGGSTVGSCFLIDYIREIAPLPTSLSVGATPFLPRANDFEAGALIPLMWSYCFLGTVYSSPSLETSSLQYGDSTPSINAMWLKLRTSRLRYLNHE